MKPLKAVIMLGELNLVIGLEVSTDTGFKVAHMDSTWETKSKLDQIASIVGFLNLAYQEGFKAGRQSVESYEDDMVEGSLATF